MGLKPVQLIVLSLTIFLGLQSVFCEWSNVVQTTSGPIRGKILKTGISGIPFAAFMGIPYAQPPTGQRRFKSPIPVNPWTEVLNATNKGIICSQINLKNKFEGREDCLILNIYTPIFTKRHKAKLPVLVWIHGGAFFEGHSNYDKFRPDYFIEKGLIMAAINYRLSALGFLNVNRPGATGNAGLKDQNLALKWIKKNIKKFGGNPKKITIFGQSAGSASVGYHVLSDMSKVREFGMQYIMLSVCNIHNVIDVNQGLFRGAISHSGSPICPYWGYQTNVDSIRMAFMFGKELGILTLDPDILVEKLYNVSDKLMASTGRRVSMIAFKPTVELSFVAPNEKKFLTECPRAKYSSGNFNKVPQIIGFNSAELLPIVPPIIKAAGKISNKNSEFKELVEFGRKLGIVIPTGTNISDRVLLDLTNQLSDLFFVAPIDKTQQYLAKSTGKNPIFYYRFSFSPKPSIRPRARNLPGVVHSEELYYLFYNYLANKTVKDPGVATHIKVMVDMWSNFTKFLNPTPDVHTERSWPDSRVLGPNSTVHLEIGPELSLGGRPLDDDAKRYQFLLDEMKDDCRYFKQSIFA